VNVWRDVLLEPAGQLAAEHQLAVAHGGASHPELVTAAGEAMLVALAQPLARDHGLAMAPAGVVAGVASVVAVPRGDGALVELFDELIADRPRSVGEIGRVVQPRELLHRNGVEADAVAGRSDLVGERGEHLVLPLAVLALLLSVAHAERHVVV
jgi:hypothetical protein